MDSESPIIVDRDGDIRIAVYPPSTPSDTTHKVVTESAAKDEVPQDTKLADTGPKPIEIVASSTILSLASPVFKRMLNGKFREAAEFAQKKASSEQYTLSLPEEDAEGTVLLLRILHFDTAHIPDIPSPANLESLAFVADKYQCAHVLKHCGGFWLCNWLRAESKGQTRIEDMCKMLAFSYVADLPVEFAAVAWRLVLSHKGPIYANRSLARALVDHGLFREDVAGYIDEKRLELCQGFSTAMMAPLHFDWKTMDDGCFRAAKTIGAYLKWLGRFGLVSHDLQFSNHSVQDLLDSVRHPELPVISTTKYPCTMHSCKCRSDGKAPNDFNLLGNLAEACSRLELRSSSFICLNCIKTDGASRSEGKCRVRHA